MSCLNRFVLRLEIRDGIYSRERLSNGMKLYIAFKGFQEEGCHVSLLAVTGRPLHSSCHGYGHRNANLWDSNLHRHYAM